MSQRQLTASNLVSLIGQLPKNRAYQYIDPKNKGLIEIYDVTYPEGPIRIKRFDPSEGKTSDQVKPVSMSSEMLWRVANAMTPNRPVNFDRILAASYNTRSVLEALLAHTPQFFICNPGRIETLNSSSKIKPGHKHLMWSPDKTHTLGVVEKIDTDIVISEVPSVEVVYEALTVVDSPDIQLDIEIKRRHAQIQYALIEIGRQLGYRTWVAHNDKGIVYNNRKFGEMEGVITALDYEKLLMAYEDARKAAFLIDCIWFRNSKFMPAVIEIEHSTGVTRGLSRMKNLQDTLPPFPTRYVVVASDEDRDKVIRESNKPQFRSLNAKYFPYSAVEELYSLCQRRKLKGVTEEFLDCYMESVLTEATLQDDKKS